jgi:hypothetical protein
MRRRALLGLLGTSMATSGCLKREGRRYVDEKLIGIGDRRLVKIGDDECLVDNDELRETLDPFSTSHQVSPGQYLRLLD